MLENGIAGLLHLSALAVVATAAYVGIDRLDGGEDRFVADIAKAATIAEAIVEKLGFSNGAKLDGKRWGKISTIFPACVICYAASSPIKLGIILGTAHVLYRQWHIPLLGYYRSKFHIWFIAGFSLLSFLIFLTLVAAPIWGLEFVEAPLLMKSVFWILTGFISWTFLSGALSYRFRGNSLQDKCEELKSVIDRRMEKMKNDAREILKDFDDSSAA